MILYLIIFKNLLFKLSATFRFSLRDFSDDVLIIFVQFLMFLFSLLGVCRSRLMLIPAEESSGRSADHTRKPLRKKKKTKEEKQK